MSETSELQEINIYEDNFINNVIDLSSQNLKLLPEICNDLLTVIYLQNNKIDVLPDTFFPSLPHLMWLDLRENCITCIPKTIKNHPSLSHLLLQNNKITRLPNELGTVKNLRVLQLSGNPITFPACDVIKAGTATILSYLHENFLNESQIESPSYVSETNVSETNVNNTDYVLYDKARSYNSVLDAVEPHPRNAVSIKFNEKDNDVDEETYYSRYNGKCPKLAKSRSKVLLPYYQSSKYLKPLRACNKVEQERKIRDNILKDFDKEKEIHFITTRDKILQARRNNELLKNWRHSYRNRQLCTSQKYSKAKLVPEDFPYDTSAEYMTILTREDIEKELPDKYRRRLTRRSKPSVPRKNNDDVHLAMKIKQLFENLEAIDLNGESMTPRTEQKALLGEIHKISEIKQKLKELSTTNIVLND